MLNNLTEKLESERLITQIKSMKEYYGSCDCDKNPEDLYYGTYLYRQEYDEKTGKNKFCAPSLSCLKCMKCGKIFANGFNYSENMAACQGILEEARGLIDSQKQRDNNFFFLFLTLYFSLVTSFLLFLSRFAN